jgi:hypothetical protein
MKKLLFLFALLPTIAFASDDSVSCDKHPDGSVHCKAKKDGVIVDAITINGGNCEVPSSDKVLHHPYDLDEKFAVPIKREGIPGLSACGYISSVTVKTHDGKSKTFAPL